MADLSEVKSKIDAGDLKGAWHDLGTMLHGKGGGVHTNDDPGGDPNPGFPGDDSGGTTPPPAPPKKP